MTERDEEAVPPWDRLGCQRAHLLALHLHEGQVDGLDQPYIGHLERVAGHLVRLFPDASAPEVQAALLHDALRDTVATLGILAGAGVDAEALGMVLQLTWRGRGTYEEWIAAIARGNPGAVRVKLADLADMVDQLRALGTPEGAELIARRYAPAQATLEVALARVAEPECGRPATAGAAATG